MTGDFGQVRHREETLLHDISVLRLPDQFVVRSSAEMRQRLGGTVIRGKNLDTSESKMSKNVTVEADGWNGSNRLTHSSQELESLPYKSHSSRSGDLQKSEGCSGATTSGLSPR